MEVKVAQQGPELRMQIIFDDPQQSIVFREEFEAMMSRVAERLGGIVVESDDEGNITKEAVREQTASVVNKFASKEE